MRLFSVYLLSSCQVVSVFAASNYSQPAHIKWGPCSNTTEIPLPIQCGTVLVPLDYTNKTSDAKIPIELQQLPATKGPKKGSILLNFGGPGSDGIRSIVKFGKTMQTVSGGVFDLVNVIPRGTGKRPSNIPFSCSHKPEGQHSSHLMTRDLSDDALGAIWSKATLAAERCTGNQTVNGTLMGTAFVARDLMKVVDALNEDGMLRYWGSSYGTLLGATTAAMFPERVDRMLLDGVVNPYEYYQNNWVEFIDSLDDAFRGFCKECVSTPKNCSLAKGQTAQELEDSILSLFNTIKRLPVPIADHKDPAGGWLLDDKMLKRHVMQVMYAPLQWPKLADTLSAVMNGSAANVAVRIINWPWGDTSSRDAYYAIRCGDAVSPNLSFDQAPSIVASRRERSPLFHDVVDAAAFICGQWKFRAKERYGGDFSVKTKNPILLLGNSYDPVTPLASAHNVSDALEGSVVLQHDSYGHCSMAQASLCTAKAIGSYFVNGTMPKKGTVCGADVGPFSGTRGWDDVLSKLNSTSG